MAEAPCLHTARQEDYIIAIGGEGLPRGAVPSTRRLDPGRAALHIRHGVTVVEDSCKIQVGYIMVFSLFTPPGRNVHNVVPEI